VRRSCDAEIFENQILMLATLGERNLNEAIVAPMVKSGGICARLWSMESGGQFCVGKNPTSVAVKMFSRLNYFINKYYKCCPFQCDLQR
jgi:hypothetical protein